MGTSRASIAISAFVMAYWSIGRCDSTWIPTLGDIHNVESHLRLPAGAAALQTYTREYAGRVEGGHHIIVGVYSGEGGNIVIDKASDVPDDVMDGGCGIINLKFDLTAHKLLRLQCHGVA